MRDHGSLDQLEIRDVPEPLIEDSRSVLVRIKSAALNHLDLWTLGGLPGLTLDMPHILGGDGAGTIEAVGREVDGWQPGDRVLFNPGLSCYACRFCHMGEQSLCTSYRLLGEHVHGTLAEFVAVPVENLAPMPQLEPPLAELTWHEAAAFSLVTLTAWRMLSTRARLQAGETILIWGIGGGVSLAALKIAKLRGARVIVTSSSDHKLEEAGRLGADFLLNHREQDISREVRRITSKEGVDVVLDSVGEDTWEQSLRCLGPMGRLVTCGATSGPRVTTDVRRLFWYQYEIMGSTMGNAREYGEIVRLLTLGHLRPTVDSVFPLEAGRDAFHRLESGEHFGKVVVEIA